MQEKMESKKPVHSIEIEDEINKIISILKSARFERRKVIYSKKDALWIIGGLLLLGVGGSVLYYGANNASIRSNGERDYTEGTDQIFNAVVNNWLFKDDGNGTCIDRYSLYLDKYVFSCPPSAEITLEFCKQFLLTYCQSLAEFNSREASLPPDSQVALSIVFGIVLLLGSFTILSALFCSDNCMTRKKQEPYSHPYIPKEYRNHIYNVAQYLSLTISKEEPLDIFIQALKERLTEINNSRKSRLTFFSGKFEGKSKENTESDLYHFFRICNKDVLYKILTYADPGLPNIKNFPYFPYNENDDNELTQLISETPLFNV